MRRLIFNVAAGLSLLLLVTTVGLWVDSHRYYRCVGYQVSSHGWWSHNPSARSDRGRVGLCLYRWPGEEKWYCSRVPVGTGCTQVGYLGLWVFDYRELWGFGYARSKRFPLAEAYPRRYLLIVPHWFLALVFAIIPTLWFRRWRGRFPAGHCQRCGYDLRASEERCPECGTPIPAASGGPATTPTE